jgi:gamma-glutamyl hercynylcysteine S-oxide synthase
MHEDMHHEAALYMAQALGVDVRAGRWLPQADVSARQDLHFDAALVQHGSAPTGFAFDNELPAHALPVAAFAIDSRTVNWAEYLPFIEAGGYKSASMWSAAGRAWLAQHAPRAPRDLHHNGSGWLQRFGPHWTALDPTLPAVHLNHFEAQAWCQWAGRRLPTEAEWERAATERADAFNWGQVWEWTASPFAPYPGFVAHPYREYSAPWFDGRPVLRGASFMTQPRMKNPRYRNYFFAGRSDIAAGFRSCAL